MDRLALSSSSTLSTYPVPLLLLLIKILLYNDYANKQRQKAEEYHEINYPKRHLIESIGHVSKAIHLEQRYLFLQGSK